MVGTRDFSSNIQANRQEYQLSSYLNKQQQYQNIERNRKLYKLNQD